MAITIKKPVAAGALSLTPLIDVVFLLLIFFLVASQFAREDTQLPLKLPSAASALPMTMDPEILTVNIAADGRYFVSGEYLTLDELSDRIARAVRDNPVSQSVVIRGDRTVPYQSVVDALDICHANKVPNYRLTTAPREQGP